MPDYTVTTTDSEETALQWVAENSTQGQTDTEGNPVPPPTAAEYFDLRMHEVLHSYEQQHAVQTAVAPVDDVAVAYATGTPEQQAQVVAVLGVSTSKPA